MEEENLQIALMFGNICEQFIFLKKKKKLKRLRRWSVRPINRDRKSAGYFEKVFKPMKFNDQEQFFIHTRMPVDLFEMLFGLMKKFFLKTSIREPICPEQRLSLTLMHLAHGVSYQALAWSHKLGKTTVRNIVMETCEALWDVLSPIYMSEPTEVQYMDIAKEYSEFWNMPNCVGAIDGKHIAITCPNNSGSMFYNYKKFFSIVLLATCDAKYTFTSVTVGSYGSESDGGIFRTSEFGRALLSNTLPLPPDCSLPNQPGVPFPHYFVGDAAFPLKRNVMRPFPSLNLSRTKRIFNYRLCRARRLIENTFGILVARWRLLRRTIECHPDNCEKIVLACVVLHNFIMLNDFKRWYCPEKFVDWEKPNNLTHEGNWREEIDGNGSSLRSIRTHMRNSSAEAFAIRNNLAAYFLDKGSVPFQNRVVDLIYGSHM